MVEVVLDGREIAAMEEVHDRFAQALEFPAYYGRNLDALFDCLTDVQEDVTIRLRCWSVLEERLSRRGRALTVLLRRAAEENPRIALLEETEEN